MLKLAFCSSTVSQVFLLNRTDSSKFQLKRIQLIMNLVYLVAGYIHWQRPSSRCLIPLENDRQAMYPVLLDSTQKMSACNKMTSQMALCLSQNLALTLCARAMEESIFHVRASRNSDWRFLGKHKPARCAGGLLCDQRFGSKRHGNDDGSAVHRQL